MSFRIGHIVRASPGIHFRILVILFFSAALQGISSAQTAPSSGPWVRDIFLRGNQVTRPEVILREMAVRRGDPLTPEALERDRERVYNLQIFNKVDVDSHIVGDSADLYVSVDERWYFYPFPVIGIRHRDWSKWVYGVGVAHLNLGGWNQKLFAQAATGYDKWVQINFRNPRFLDTEDYYFGLQGQYAHLHPLSLDGSEYQEEVWLAKLSLGKRFGYEQTLVGTIGVESWRAPSGTVRRTANLDGRDVFLTASLQFVDDRRYLREYPMEGSYVFLNLSKFGFGESEVDLTVLRVDLRTYVPVWLDWSVAVRGYTSLMTGGAVPSYRHVFFGYDERIRGEFRTKYEGEGQAGANVELRIPIMNARYFEADFIPVPQFRTLRYGFYAALWADGGKIWYRSESPFKVPTHAGYGVGIHAILPYGLIARFDAGLDRSGNLDLIFDAGVSF